jgi:hypothetical protein
MTKTKTKRAFSEFFLPKLLFWPPYFTPVAFYHSHAPLLPL